MPTTILRRATVPLVPTSIPILQTPVLPRLAAPPVQAEPHPPHGEEEGDEEEMTYEVGDPTALPTPTTRWIRTPHASHATRSDGIVLWDEGDGWSVTVNGELAMTCPSSGTPANMEACIASVDLRYPPEPWAVDAEGRVWQASVWRVISEDGLTWCVYRELDGKLARASRQVFVTADRARRWAELRFDRGSAGLRGPKPRAGARSRAKLPDVRVTEDERARMQAALEQVGMSYSEMVRASAYWVEENLLGASPPWAVERMDNGVVRFVRTKA